MDENIQLKDFLNSNREKLDVWTITKTAGEDLSFPAVK